MAQGQPVPRAVRLDELVLGHPVALAAEGQGIGLEALEAVLPHVEGAIFLRRQPVGVAEAQGPAEVLRLDVEGAHLPPVGEANLATAGEIVTDLADGPNRVLEGQVAQHRAGVLQHA